MEGKGRLGKNKLGREKERKREIINTGMNRRRRRSIKRREMLKKWNRDRLKFK